MPQKDLFRIEKLGLTLAGLSLDERGRFYKTYSLYVTVILLCMYPLVLLLGLLTQRFNEALEGWIMFIGYVMVVPVVLMFQFCRKEIEGLLDRFEDDAFTASEDAVALVKTWLMRKNLKASVFLVALCLSIISQMIYCLTLRFTKTDPNEWKLGFGAISLINTTYSPNYEIAYFYQNLSLFYGIILNLIITIIITGALDFVATQCKVLQIQLKTILGDSGRYAKWRFYQSRVKSFVLYHIDVMNLVGGVSKVFSPTIFCFFLGILVINCIEIYRTSLLPLQNVNTARNLIEALTACFQILLICNAGENMAQESEKIFDAAYEVDFLGTDLRFQKCLVIIMRQCRKPIKLKAGKLIEISLVSFALVLRASYSAYAMLKNVNV